jgi:4-hydroxybenzoyl-CoA reductase subunit alpha
MNGRACLAAARRIASRLRRSAARITGRPEGRFVCRDLQLVDVEDPACAVPYAEALEDALAENGALVASGSYTTPTDLGASYRGASIGLAPAYSFNAFVSRVSVDPGTGFVRVRKVWAAHDCGKALNPTAVEGQIEGSIHMGLGQLLMEEFAYQGPRILNPNLLDYRILSPAEMPEVECILVESLDQEGPYGAKEAGEGPLLPVLPSVSNAIHDAVGVRLWDLPFTPDKVLAAIERQQRGMPEPGSRRWSPDEAIETYRKNRSPHTVRPEEQAAARPQP